MDAEKKLAEYRTRRRRQIYLKSVNDKFRSILPFGQSSSKSVKMEADDEASKKLLIDSSGNDEVASNAESEDLNCNISFVTILKYILCFILWCTWLAIFVKLQFGLVFCVLSGLVAIYLNTRSGPKAKDEISAYSVFNRNCESIDGTISAEQFERELRFGYAGVR